MNTSAAYQNDVNYRDKHFLIVDDQASTRQSLRTILQNLGASQVTLCAGYKDTVSKLRSGGRQPDVVLCDYNLEEEFDGQQLFEEMRRSNLIREHTIFLMVTSERSYESVISIAEMSPDDYILKPFTPDQLKVRLDRVAAKKIFLKAYYIAKLKNDISGALLVLKQLEGTSKGQGQYRFVIKRMQAETLLAARRLEEAKQLLEAVLALHPFPWARLYLAKVHYLEKAYGPAEFLLDELVMEAPDYLSAYDLIATVNKEQGNYARAQQILLEVSAKNPRNWDRKKALVEVATLNKDEATAKTVMADLIRNSVGAKDASLEARLELARIAIRCGDYEGARSALSSVQESQLEKFSELEQIGLLALQTILDPARFKAGFDRYRNTILSNLLPTLAVGFDIVRAGLSVKDVELASRMALVILGMKLPAEGIKQLETLFDDYAQRPVFSGLLKQANG